MEVRTCHELGEHAARFAEQCSSECALFDLEAIRNRRQMPNRVDRNLCDAHIVGIGDKLAVGFEPTGFDRIVDLGKRQMRLSNGNGRLKIDAFV